MKAKVSGVIHPWTSQLLSSMKTDTNFYDQEENRKEKELDKTCEFQVAFTYHGLITI